MSKKVDLDQCQSEREGFAVPWCRGYDPSGCLRAEDGHVGWRYELIRKRWVSGMGIRALSSRVGDARGCTKIDNIDRYILRAALPCCVALIDIHPLGL